MISQKKQGQKGPATETDDNKTMVLDQFQDKFRLMNSVKIDIFV